MASRLTAIETIRTPLQPNVLLVLIHDEQGNVGLGETFYGAGVVDAYVHEVAVPALAGTELAAPSAVAEVLAGYVGYSGSGAETRGNSAIDIALWDLLAKRARLPLRDLLGGPSRPTISVYNTCAGNDYVRHESRQASSNWGLAGGGSAGPYEDLWGFLNEPARLARELVDAGFSGMKVWPFDLAAEQAGGDRHADLRAGLEVLDAIRSEVGGDIDLYLELHGLWTPAGAQRLFRHLEEFDLAWAEDPIRGDKVEGLVRLSESSSVPIALGENLGTGANQYKPLLEARALDVAILDLGWGGGITAGLKTATLAESFGVPVAPHDCTGPVSLAVATHFVTAIPNGYVQEVARAFYHGWYQDVANGLPTLEDGLIRPGDGWGHGVELTAAFLARPDTVCRRSTL